MAMNKRWLRNRFYSFLLLSDSATGERRGEENSCKTVWNPSEKDGKGERNFMDCDFQHRFAIWIKYDFWIRNEVLIWIVEEVDGEDERAWKVGRLGRDENIQIQRKSWINLRGNAWKREKMQRKYSQAWKWYEIAVKVVQRTASGTDEADFSRG